MRRFLLADQLIDGFNDKPIKNGVLILQDKKIEAVTTQDQIGNDPDGEIINVAGGTIMPGFIEMLEHSFYWGKSVPKPLARKYV